MGKENVVGSDVRLGPGISSPAEGEEEDGATARSLEADVVALRGERVRLVEGDPVLHSVPEFPKTRIGIYRKVLAEFFQKKRKEKENSKKRRRRRRFVSCSNPIEMFGIFQPRNIYIKKKKPIYMI